MKLPKRIIRKDGKEYDSIGRIYAFQSSWKPLKVPANKRLKRAIRYITK